jgi:hypothetical protein
MGLNNIELNAALLQDLYAKSLVLADEDSRPAEAKKESLANVATKPQATTSDSINAALPVLGHNKKGITIIVDYPELPHLPDAMLDFLTRMLQACKLSMADVAIYNFAGNRDIVAKDITSQLKSKTVLLFGLDPMHFGLSTQFPEFQVQPLAGIVYLYAPALEICQSDKLIKSRLWVCLQRIFDI